MKNPTIALTIIDDNLSMEEEIRRAMIRESPISSRNSLTVKKSEGVCLICGQSGDTFECLYDMIEISISKSVHQGFKTVVTTIIYHRTYTIEIMDRHTCKFLAHQACWVEFLNNYNLVGGHPCPNCKVHVLRPYTALREMHEIFVRDKYKQAEKLFQEFLIGREAVAREWCVGTSALPKFQVVRLMKEKCDDMLHDFKSVYYPELSKLYHRYLNHPMNPGCVSKTERCLASNRSHMKTREGLQDFKHDVDWDLWLKKCDLDRTIWGVSS